MKKLIWLAGGVATLGGTVVAVAAPMVSSYNNNTEVTDDTVTIDQPSGGSETGIVIENIRYERMDPSWYQAMETNGTYTIPGGYVIFDVKSCGQKDSEGNFTEKITVESDHFDTIQYDCYVGNDRKTQIYANSIGYGDYYFNLEFYSEYTSNFERKNSLVFTEGDYKLSINGSEEVTFLEIIKN